MKGIFFQKPLEFALQADGESWVQGSEIHGTLEIRKHSEEAPEISPVVHLAQGDFKKVREKKPEAFKIIASHEMLPSNAHTTLSWSFKLDRNSPITEKSNGVFLLYGSGGAIEKLGHLELNVKPEPIIEEFLKTIEVHFRFVRRFVKWGKGWVGVKLMPPDSKAFSSLEHLMLSFRFNGDTLELEYEFNVTRVEPTATGASVQKKKIELEQKIEATRYLLPSGRIKTEEFEAAIREALVPVESKVLF